MSGAATQNFLIFQERVAADSELSARLRPIVDHDAFVAAVVAEGAAQGLAFTAAEVETACAANRHRWLLSWLPDA